MSENIFAEIYNRILGLFGQSSQKEESKNEAVNRLRLVLMQDRTNLTPEIMNRMRTELIEVLSRYVVLDKDALDLNIGQEGEQMALMLSIPVVRAKDESEIEEALKKESDSEEDNQDENEGENKSEEETYEESDETPKEASEESEEESESETEAEENLESSEEADSESEVKTEESSDSNENSENETKEPKTKKTKKSE